MKKRKYVDNKEGFTLIEVLVVIGIIAILAAIVLIAINPARQFKLARDSQRTANVNAILNAIGQNISENKGIFTCGASSTIPLNPTIMKSTGGYDVAPCIVPTYISGMPYDPSANNAHYTSNADYDTEYTISQDANSRITVSAVSEISTTTISMTR